MTEAKKVVPTVLEWLKAALATLIPGDKAKGTKYIAEHPEEFGFAWGEGAIGTGTKGSPQYKELRSDCPYIDVTPESLPLFLATFGPGMIHKGLMGQSIKVQCDRVNRTTLGKNLTIKGDALKEKIVSNVLLGTITRTMSTPKYMVKGVAYSSEAAAKQAEANNAKIEELEKCSEFLKMASENGVDPTLAKQMAATMFPSLAEQLSKVAEPVEAKDEELLEDLDEEQDEEMDQDEDEQDSE